MCFALIFLFDWVQKNNKLLTHLPTEYVQACDCEQCVFVCAVDRLWVPLQHSAGQRPGAVRGNTGHPARHQQGPVAQHEHHRPLHPHGHLPEPGCQPGHWGWGWLSCQLFVSGNATKRHQLLFQYRCVCVCMNRGWGKPGRQPWSDRFTRTIWAYFVHQHF